MPWPVDVADGQVILASHINAIKDSVQTWQGNVNANGWSVSNAVNVQARTLQMITDVTDATITIGEGVAASQYMTINWDRVDNRMRFYYAGIGQVMLIGGDGMYLQNIITTTAGPPGTGKLYKDASGFLKIS